MIVITGANGTLGRGIVEQLLGRVPAEKIAVSVRDPEQARELAVQGVRVRRGDFTDPASLTHAFEGASQVLIVSAATTGGAAITQHRTAIEAAEAAGTHRILYTSHMGVNPSSPFPPMVDHAATEALLRESGMAFTSLRNGFYASTTLWLLTEALKTGELTAPQDGPVSWTAHADLAEAAAITLAEESFDGPTPALTAGAALDLAGAAELAAELTGRTIRRVVVPDEQYRASLLAQGLPEARVELTLGLFAASRQGEFAHVDPALAHLLGRPTTPLREVLKAGLIPAG